MKKKALTIEMIERAVAMEMKKYDQATKFHLEGLMSKDATAEVADIHGLALCDIFDECPILLDFLIHEAENKGGKLPEMFTNSGFRENLRERTVDQMEKIVRNLIKEQERK